MARSRSALLAAITVALLAGVAIGIVAPEAPSTETTGPLTDRLVWVGGTLTSVDGTSVTIRTGERPLTLGTEHAVFFVPTGNRSWRSVEHWQHRKTGTRVCIAAHLHANDERHVVKAFYNGSCGVSPRRAS